MRLVFACLASALIASAGVADSGLDLERLAALRHASNAVVSPNGSAIAYTLSVPRQIGVDDNGSAWRELHMVNVENGQSRAWVRSESPRGVVWMRDGRHLLFLGRRGDDTTRSVYALPTTGGEAFRLLSFDRDIDSFEVSPDGRTIAFRARAEEPDERVDGRELGFDQEIFEEEVPASELWLIRIPEANPAPADPSAPAIDDDGASEPRHLERADSVGGVAWVDNRRLAVAVQPRNLIDDRYVRRQLQVIAADSGETLARIDNVGKLGSFAASPNGETLAMITVEDRNDPADGRLAVVPTATGGTPRDLLPGLEGHVADFVWTDDDTLLALLELGTETTVAEIDLDGSRRDVFSSGDGAPVITDLARGLLGTVAMIGETPQHPDEVYLLDDGAPRRLTNSNPWLADVALGKQETIRWTASDGLEIEGVLIHPLDGQRPAPLLLMVHGGPEAHDRNGWLTNYSRPGQSAAARGYAVLYPNYRGSTGRGVAFSKAGQQDAAGKEFQDLAEAVDHLIEIGVADPDNVGITGGSYGGYATAWGSTFYTERFAAGVMFVGISNKLSKPFTTDIPYEDIEVHTLVEPWTKWQFNLERSPLYYAEQSRTPLLIAHGQEDTRVHPSQSLQLYRALKLLGNVPVRYVRYPDEGHGNRRAASRYDYSRRVLRWFDHFLLEGGTDLPPVDLPPSPLVSTDEVDADEAEVRGPNPVR
ncbi:MAG: S9 family peptidase [Acidobacteriota bacterium]